MALLRGAPALLRHPRDRQNSLEAPLSLSHRPPSSSHTPGRSAPIKGWPLARLVAPAARPVGPSGRPALAPVWARAPQPSEVPAGLVPISGHPPPPRRSPAAGLSAQGRGSPAVVGGGVRKPCRSPPPPAPRLARGATDGIQTRSPSHRPGSHRAWLCHLSLPACFPGPGSDYPGFPLSGRLLMVDGCEGKEVRPAKAIS